MHYVSDNWQGKDWIKSSLQHYQVDVPLMVVSTYVCSAKDNELYSVLLPFACGWNRLQDNASCTCTVCADCVVFHRPNAITKQAPRCQWNLMVHLKEWRLHNNIFSMATKALTPTLLLDHFRSINSICQWNIDLLTPICDICSTNFRIFANDVIQVVHSYFYW